MKTRDQWVEYFDENIPMGIGISEILNDWKKSLQALYVEIEVYKQKEDTWRLKYNRMAKELEEIKSNIRQEGEYGL